MPHTFVPPPASWSFELPDNLKLKIADAITLFSRIDSNIVEARWAAEGADYERKKAIARKPAVDNIEALKGMVAAMGLEVASTPRIWEAFDQLKWDRNLIAHGVWMIDDEGVPWVVWHSKFLEDDNNVVGEMFDHARFDRMLAIARHLQETTVKFLGMVQKIEDEMKKRGSTTDA